MRDVTPIFTQMYQFAEQLLGRRDTYDDIVSLTSEL